MARSACMKPIDDLSVTTRAPSSLSSLSDDMDIDTKKHDIATDTKKQYTYTPLQTIIDGILARKHVASTAPREHTRCVDPHSIVGPCATVIYPTKKLALKKKRFHKRGFYGWDLNAEFGMEQDSDFDDEDVF